MLPAVSSLRINSVQTLAPHFSQFSTQQKCVSFVLSPRASAMLWIPPLVKIIITWDIAVCMMNCHQMQQIH